MGNSTPLLLKLTGEYTVRNSKISVIRPGGIYPKFTVLLYRLLYVFTPEIVTVCHCTWTASNEALGYSTSPIVWIVLNWIDVHYAKALFFYLIFVRVVFPLKERALYCPQYFEYFVACSFHCQIIFCCIVCCMLSQCVLGRIGCDILWCV